ncbi:NAD(P)-dependent oxidoreductase [Jiangella alkaliphila]|uniref:NmrA-like family protein n=1 Tax=Jiangella alkaliphila TaxID=419479 RepID=A0A1H2LVC8_9ACTN|nr:NAD(P)-binding oxidoreductase [Jiangella alkaliphila]SDU84802.1 NmrA-like family protein [Jiangella alkaliphila]
MKLTVVAATGGVGRHVLEQAVDAGHDVTAIVRNPAGLTRPVRTEVADLAAPDAAALESAVAGVGLTKDAGAGIFIRYVVTPLSNRFMGRHYADVALMEDLLRGSGLEWTAVGLPLLTDKPPTGRYRTAYGQSVRRGLRISRADAAGFLLHAVDQPVTFGQTVAVAY